MFEWHNLHIVPDHFNCTDAFSPRSIDPDQHVYTTIYWPLLCIRHYLRCLGHIREQIRKKKSLLSECLLTPIPPLFFGEGGADLLFPDSITHPPSANAFEMLMFSEALWTFFFPYTFSLCNTFGFNYLLYIAL